MIRRDILDMAAEVALAREDFGEILTPLDVVAMLDGGDCNDPTGRAAILILTTPGLVSLEEAQTRGFPEELIEAAALSEAASLEAASGGRNGD